MRCTSCGHSVMWASTHDGYRIPLDSEPVRGGNIVISVSRNEAGPGQHIHAHVLPVEQLVAEPVRYMSHLVTCPTANDWRVADAVE